MVYPIPLISALKTLRFKSNDSLRTSKERFLICIPEEVQFPVFRAINYPGLWVFNLMAVTADSK